MPFQHFYQRLGTYPSLVRFNPYYEPFSANNTSSNHELDVGTFCPTQYKPYVFLAHHSDQTHNNINLLVGVYSKHRHLSNLILPLFFSGFLPISHAQEA